MCEFGVWTVDDPDLARFYVKHGAWSITTNRPGWLREQLADPRP
jgi:glycerophosphoryl diester phosphodiesterase